MKTLKDLFLKELADMYDAERQIVRALPKMAGAATYDKLKAAFQSHLNESEGHVKKLEQVFRSFDQKVNGKTCEATVGLLMEGNVLASEFKGSPAINAALIAAAQKVEHYEIASYGCLHEWSSLLGNEEAAHLLKQILDEENCANAALNELAHATSNREALGGAVPEGPPEDAPDERPAISPRGIRPGKLKPTRIKSPA